MTNLCYCEGPWTGRKLPTFMVNRAHIPGADCVKPAVVKSPWLRRREAGELTAKELAR